jgi:hypothetical protein
MRTTVTVFVVPRGLPTMPPRPGPSLEVEASGVDDLRRSAIGALVARGHRVRCVSFTPTGLLAYVEEAP